MRRRGGVAAAAMGLVVAVAGCGPAQAPPAGGTATTPAPGAGTTGPSTTGPGTTGGTPTDHAPATPVPSLTWTTERLSGSDGPLTWDVEVPHSAGPALAREVNRRVRTSVEHAVQDARATVLPADPPRLIQGSGAVTTDDGRTVQVRLELTDHTEGTAHPTTSVRTVALDAADGSPLTLDQLFEDETTALQTLAAEVRALAADAGEDVDEEGLLPVRENWGAWQTTPRGMTVWFQDYQLGGHGIREHTIGWDVLETVMTPQALALLGPLQAV